MKNLLATFIITLAFIFSQSLEVGMKAPDWVFKDADGVEFTMDSWEGKILQINYVDPDESDLNESFNDAVKKTIDEDKLISRDHFKGFGIVDCAATWKPDFLIRMIAGKKAKKFDTTILFDYDAELRNSWDLKKDSYNVIILDKNRICRAIIKGIITEEKQAELIQLIIELQKEK